MHIRLIAVPGHVRGNGRDGRTGLRGPAAALPSVRHCTGAIAPVGWELGWSNGLPGYDIQHVVADTEALLTPSTPVIVRMETLRRAALYASQDAKVASALLDRMLNRARSAEAAGHPDAMAFLDAAYVSEAFREIAMLGDSSQFRARAAAVRPLVENGRGYSLIERSLTLRPNDAALHFAAALIAADNNRAAYTDHAAKAKAGAASDPLLTRNIDHVS